MEILKFKIKLMKKMRNKFNNLKLKFKKVMIDNNNPLNQIIIIK